MRVYLKCNGCNEDQCCYSAKIFESDKNLFCNPKNDNAGCGKKEINWSEIQEPEYSQLTRYR